MRLAEAHRLVELSLRALAVNRSMNSEQTQNTANGEGFR